MNWRPVVGYEGLYEVSDTGSVRSMRGVLKTTKGKLGYIRADLTRNGKTTHTSVHRLVASAFLPHDPIRDCVNHIDSDRSNNHVANLEWCTRKENTQHSLAKSRANTHKGVGYNKLSKTHCPKGHAY